MTALTQSIDHLIEEQINRGSAHSEIEAEQMIISEVTQRTIDRKIAISQEQVKNGQYTEFNETFVKNFLAKAKARHSIK